jgi:hypothetical protein
MSVYALGHWLVGDHALAVALAFSASLVVYFQRRWRPQIPSYDMQLANLGALVSLSPLRSLPVLPYSDMALDGIELNAVISYAMLNEPKCIVECGSGVSTVMLGNLLKARESGHLYALEEDEGWCRLMLDLVRAQGLDQYVTVYWAPVEGTWYARTVARKLIEEVERIDLLLVDGPQTKDVQSRYDALGYFRERLDASSVVMLHDVNRAQESEILRRWQAEFDVSVERVLGAEGTDRGLAIMRVTPGVDPS